MMNLVRPIVLNLLALVLVAGTLSAQDSEPSKGEPVFCGTDLMSHVDIAQALDNTRRATPEVYQRIMATAKHEGATISSAAQGTEHDFINYDYDKSRFQTTHAVLRFVGKSFRLWIDVQDSLRIGSDVIAQLAAGLDTLTGSNSRDPNKGILENTEDVYGLPPVNQYSSDLITDFLMLDIKDGSQGGGNILGFFSPTDQVDPLVQPISNGMNLLYIDSQEGLQGGMSRLLSTIAHEFQHLIHYNRKRNSLTFLNEGCSEESSILSGYSDRRDDSYLKNTNVNFFRWTKDLSATDDLLADYTRAMTWVHYLAEQYGEQFLYEFTGAKTDSMARVDEALGKIGRTDIDWRETLKGFAVANYVQTNAQETAYGYRFRVASTRAKTVNYLQKDYPNSESVSLEPYGAAYYLYDRPGEMRFRYTGTKNFAVMAMIWPDYVTSVPIVQELTKDVDHLLTGPDGGYRRVVIAIVSLESKVQTVGWVSEETNISGVESIASTDRGTGISGIVPSPVTSAASIRFRTDVPGPARLQIYDAQGALVSTPLDGEVVEPGDHEIRFDAAGLANGVYMVRLTSGGTVTARSLVVVR